MWGIYVCHKYLWHFQSRHSHTARVHLATSSFRPAGPAHSAPLVVAEPHTIPSPYFSRPARPWCTCASSTQPHRPSPPATPACIQHADAAHIRLKQSFVGVACMAGPLACSSTCHCDPLLRSSLRRPLGPQERQKLTKRPIGAPIYEPVLRDDRATTDPASLPPTAEGAKEKKRRDRIKAMSMSVRIIVNGRVLRRPDGLAPLQVQMAASNAGMNDFSFKVRLHRLCALSA